MPTNALSGTASGKATASGAITVKRLLSGTATGKASPSAYFSITKTLSSTNPTATGTTGVRYYVAFGPQVNFEYIDAEPSGPSRSITATGIKGAVTGVPRLGSGMYLAFVGVQTDARYFGALDAPTSWGDGGGGGFTHTYSATGLYPVTIAGGTGAAALRWCRVIYPDRQAATTAVGAGNYTAFDVPYPTSIDEVTKGEMSTGFGFRCRIAFSSLDWTDAAMNQIYERCLVGIFAQEYRANTAYGNPKLVVGGWISNRTFSEQPGQRILSFTAYGPSFWMLNSAMREQFYIDPGIIGADLAANAFISAGGGNPLTTDLFGAGYVPGHFLKCDCITAALHIIQHMQVYYSTRDNPATPLNPVMDNVYGSNYYGNLGQFIQIVTDPDVDETAGKTVPGFASFNIANGMMLSNIRQMIENEGFVYYDRADLTQRIERKPYYWSNVLKAPKLAIDDVKKLAAGRSPFEASSGTQKPVRQVQVEKPLLATLSDVTNTTAGGQQYGATIRDPNNLFTILPYPLPGGGGGVTAPVSELAASWTSATKTNSFGGSNLSTDPLTATIDYTKFQARYPTIPRAFGVTIGPLTNVFSLDPFAFARGRDKEERAHWGASLPLGQVFDVDLGDIVSISYQNGKLGVNWIKKLFWVVERTMTHKPGAFECVVRVVEVDPDDALTGGGGGGGSGVPNTPTGLYTNSTTRNQTVLNFDPGFGIASTWVWDIYLNGTLNQTAPVNQAVIASLTPNTTYSVYVICRDTANSSVSPASSSISFTTLP